MSDDSLSHLIVRVQRGDREAYRLVVERTEGPVRMVVAAILPPGNQCIDDVVQETFLMAWHKLGTVQGGDHVLAWFTSIARNLALNERRSHLRELRRRAPSEAELIDSIAVPLTPPGMEADLEAALQHCLAALGDQAREVVTAHYWQDQDAACIATNRQRAIGWVHVVLSRARTALARCLRQKGMLNAPS